MGSRRAMIVLASLATLALAGCGSTGASGGGGAAGGLRSRAGYVSKTDYAP